MTDTAHQLRLRRARPVLALAAVAFATGAIVGSGHGASPEVKLAERFATAWTRGDYRTMYAEIDAASQRQISASQFAGAYEQAVRTATATRLRVLGRARHSGSTLAVPVRVRTRLFGTLSLDFSLAIEESGAGPRVRWSHSLTFPGMRSGELLSSRTTLPPRATLLTREGTVLAESGSESQSGEATRSSPLGESARAVLGQVGPVAASRLASLEAEGVPADATVGTSGLERALDDRLRGRPGGELLAGRRLLA
ncbi:MAG TPA: NTF2-like N-terminal transpeptidase domain-containing protein, partial [Solirubrobacteraceae bacterium]